MESIPPVAGVIYGLYCTCHPERGIRYVGQTTRTVERRVFEHTWDAVSRKGRSAPNTPLSHWIRKHGVENIAFRVLQEAESEDIDALEVFWIEELGTHKSDGGLNLALGGNTRRGWRHSEEARQKITKALTGRPVSEETRKKISLAQKGKPSSMSPEGLESFRRHVAERIISDETRQKISEASRGGGNGCAKITDQDVLEIRRLVAHGGLTQTQIGEMFGIDQTTVSDIKRRKSWKHI